MLSPVRCCRVLLSATGSVMHDPRQSQASPLTSQAHLPCCGGAGGATDCPGIFTICPGMLTLGFPSSRLPG